MRNNNSGLLKLALIASLAFNVLIYKEVQDLPKYGGGNTNYTETQNVTSLEISNSVTEVVEKTNDKVVSVVNLIKGQSAGSGSGIIYKNENGKLLIVTNHHVIEGAQELSVQISNGESFEAKLIGSDEYTDLALLSVEANVDIKAFEIGDSSKSKVGEYVIAMGSPLGLEFANSVTFGIISGKERVVPVDLNNDGRSDWDMIVTQTDAAINPGNSGGALVNMAGQLIGINSMKLSSNQIEGMGFSIPSNEMLNVIQQLETQGKVNYPMIGISAVSLEDINRYYYSMYSIDPKVEGGVFVAEIVKGGVAEAAGIKAGDVITHFNGKEVKTFKEFRRLLFAQKSGDEVIVTVNRAGSDETFTMVLK